MNREINKILLITHSQFGYHSDPYYLSLYLSDGYDVFFLHRHIGLKEIHNHKCKLITIPRSGNSFLYRFISICYAIKSVYKIKPDVIIVFKFPFCFILPIVFQRNKFIYDIRSGGVSEIYWKRKKNDLIVQFNSLFFKRITVISESLAKRLKINRNKYMILPVGANIISDKKKQFKNMNLLYVGTLDNRKIEDTIKGIAEFIKKNNNKVIITYTIIGSGKLDLVDKIEKMIVDYDLTGTVTLAGKKHHEELKQYFGDANIGISYIPITDYYDVQPPTKTYEYLLSGMAVIATKTYENSRIIQLDNGVLIEDNPRSFCSGLQKISESLHKYNSSHIRLNVKNYTWKNIVKNILIPLIEST